MNNYHINQSKIFTDQEFNTFVQNVEQECTKELENRPKSHTFHSIVSEFQSHLSEPSFTFFDPLAGPYFLDTGPQDLKAKKITKMVKELDTLYLEAKSLIKKLKENPKESLEEVKTKLIEIRLEILSKKSLQLSEMIDSLSQSSDKEQDPLLEELYDAYVTCLQEVAKISGDQILAHQTIKGFALENMPSWKSSLEQLDAMFLERAALGKKIMKSESELTALSKFANNPLIQLFSLPKLAKPDVQKAIAVMKYQQKQILLLKYQWTHVNLTIRAMERNLLGQIEPQGQEKDVVLKLSKENQAETQSILEAMQKTSKEIKKLYGKSALREANKKWTYTLWGEALIKKSKEIPFSDQDAGFIQNFINLAKDAVGVQDSFENKVNRLKDKIRSLKIELEKNPSNQLKDELRATQLELYQFLYSFTLSALEQGDEKDNEVLKPALDKFSNKIQSLLESYSPEATGWIKQHKLPQNVTDILAQNIHLSKTYIPILQKEYENVSKKSAYLISQEEGSEEYLKTAIEINQSKLIILQTQRTILTEISRSHPELIDSLRPKINATSIESNSIAKETEALIRKTKNLYPVEGEYIFGEFVPAVGQQFFAPWTLTDWGAILVQKESSSLTKWIFESVASLTELARTYEKTINDFQNRIDHLLGAIDEAKKAKNTMRTKELTDQLHMQKLYLSQTHLNRMIDAVGERQSTIKNLQHQITEQKKLLDTLSTNAKDLKIKMQLEKEIAELDSNLQMAQSEVNTLNNAYENLMKSYEKKYSKQQKETEAEKEKSFLETGWQFATSVMNDLLPFTDMTLPPPNELKKKMEYAQAGYSMIAEVQKFLSNAYASAKKEGQSPQEFINNFLAQEVKGFLSWAQDHPRTATLLAGDIMQVCSVLRQENLVQQIQSSLHATLYTKAALGILHGEGSITEEPIETEEAFKYRALADLLKPMPALAGGLTGAAQGLYQGGLSFGAVTNALWGALKGATVAQTAQTMRKVIPPNLEQVASITLGALQGQNIQNIIEMNRNIELVNLGGQLIRGIQKPEELLKGIKNWWEKIKLSTGPEKFARVMTQVVVPVTSVGVSAAVAVVVGTGPIGWIAAGGIVLTIATFTLSFMLFSNRFIDVAAFSRDTLKAIEQKEKEETEVLMKNYLSEHPELKNQLESVVNGYLEDFRQIGLIPTVQNPPLSFNVSENLANFIKTSEESYHTDCIMILHNYWANATDRPRTPMDLANAFREQLSSEQMKEKAEILIQQHIDSLTSISKKATDPEERQHIETLIKEIESKREELLNLMVTKEKQRLVDEWFEKHLHEMVENQFYDLYDKYQTPLDAVTYIANNKTKDLTKACKTEIQKSLQGSDLNLQSHEIKTIASTITTAAGAA